MQAGAPGRVKLGAFDMNPTNLDRIKNGTQLFAIDQQPYLQGFLAISLLQPRRLRHRAADEARPDRPCDRRCLERRSDVGRSEARHPLNAAIPTSGLRGGPDPHPQVEPRMAALARRP